jgi:hypothetical protein
MLNTLKYKTAQKSLRYNLENHTPRLKTKIQKLGILSDQKIGLETEEIQNIFKNSGLSISKLTWTSKEIGSKTKGSFSNTDLAYWGKFKPGSEAAKFASTEFDLLINFWQSETDELLLLAANIKANFKAGLPNPEKKLNDLEINTDKKSFYFFCKELNKYIKTINYE